MQIGIVEEEASLYELDAREEWRLREQSGRIIC